jgi:AbrB family looped-hinge helix DNA binding protein
MATITAKGQTTIPKPIREHLRVKAGDRVEFVVEPDGAVRLIAKTLRLADLHGMLPRPPHPVTVEAMNAAIEAGAARRFRALRRRGDAAPHAGEPARRGKPRPRRRAKSKA